MKKTRKLDRTPKNQSFERGDTSGSRVQNERFHAQEPKIIPPQNRIITNRHKKGGIGEAGNFEMQRNVTLLTFIKLDLDSVLRTTKDSGGVRQRSNHLAQAQSYWKVKA